MGNLSFGVKGRSLNVLASSNSALVFFFNFFYDFTKLSKNIQILKVSIMFECHWKPIWLLNWYRLLYRSIVSARDLLSDRPHPWVTIQFSNCRSFCSICRHVFPECWKGIKEDQFNPNSLPHLRWTAGGVIGDYPKWPSFFS